MREREEIKEKKRWKRFKEEKRLRWKWDGENERQEVLGGRKRE